MTITIDRRELQQMVLHRNISSIEELSSLIKVPVVEDTLDAGDFAFLDRDSEPLGIERAEIGNLAQKLRTGELEQQLVRCDEAYKTVILLTEGVYDHIGGFLANYKRSTEGSVYWRNRISPNMRYADIKALQVRLSELGIEIIETPNFECSMRVISVIYHQRTKPEEEHSLFKKIRPIRIPVKMSSNPAIPKLLSLCNRMPEKVAIKLINKYGSIWAVLNTEEEELLLIEGMGKGLLQNLKKGVGK